MVLAIIIVVRAGNHVAANFRSGMGRVDPRRSASAALGFCRFVGRCPRGLVTLGMLDVSDDDLAPAAAAFCFAAIMRGADRWNNADIAEFEADGIKQKG